LANSLVNALQAKRRFVESLTHHSNYGDDENFLSPPIQPPSDEPSKPAKTPQPSDAPQTRARAPQTVVKVEKPSQKSKGEIQLTESEYQRIIDLLESRRKNTNKPKQSRREENVPVWAKLAYASSNPNSQNNQYY
jgi:hypothetical protein